MAICKLNKNLDRASSCAYSLNEISKIYLANFEDVLDAAIGGCGGTGTTGHMVTGITMASGDTGEAKWYQITPAKGSGSYSDTLVANDNGSKYRVHNVGFTFNGAYDCDMPDVVDALSLGKFIAVVVNAAGEYIMLGRVMGVEADTDGANWGGEGEEAAGLTVALSGNQAEASLPLSAAAIEKVVGA